MDRPPFLSAAATWDPPPSTGHLRVVYPGTTCLYLSTTSLLNRTSSPAMSLTK